MRLTGKQTAVYRYGAQAGSTALTGSAPLSGRTIYIGGGLNERPDAVLQELKAAAAAQGGKPWEITDTLGNPVAKTICFDHDGAGQGQYANCFWADGKNFGMLTQVGKSANSVRAELEPFYKAVT